MDAFVDGKWHGDALGGLSGVLMDRLADGRDPPAGDPLGGTSGLRSKYQYP
jgi:hypothetical protein